MIRITLDIPSEKMSSFLQLMRELGIDRRAIRSRAQRGQLSSLLQGKDRNFLKKLYRSYLLFDWEFFSNELEFE